MKEIIIKIWNNAIWFNEECCIPLANSNLSPKFMTFRKQEIYWRVWMTDFIDGKVLKVNVIDYEIEDLTLFFNQVPKRKVEFLGVNSISWDKLAPLLIAGRKEEIRAVIPLQMKADDVDYLESDSTKETVSQRLPVIDFYNDTLRINFHDVFFRLGYVTFDQYIEKFDRVIGFKIPNENILPEFELVKFWFARKLKCRDLKVKIEVTTSNGEVSDCKAESAVINKINSDLISGIRYERTYALANVSGKSNPEKWLFTSDELFDMIDTNDRDGNVFNQSEEEILKYFIEQSKVRNRKQLAYLAGKKQSERYKLMFTLNPYFGFLFFIEGARSNHFIWELLNSNATYIWSIGKGEMDEQLQFKRVENCINTIRAMGRLRYKQAYRTNHQDEDILFNVLKHDKIGSDFIDNFVIWKEKINQVIT